jgi:UDP-N-acetylglucosamine 2-epimerase (hydrolysing)
VVIFPNNDMGSILILQEYERLKDRENIKIFPSVRFEYFLVMLKHAHFLIGNSSAGIREAPYYGLPVINIGSRQQNRALHEDIINCGYGKAEILSAVESALNSSFKPINLFGRGDSNELFYKVISEAEFWQISKQKQFNDLATYA